MPREVKSKKSKSSGLGKGLGNLMKVDTVESVLPEKEIHELPISELVPMQSNLVKALMRIV